MLNRRAFLQRALLGGAAIGTIGTFGAGLKLGLAGGSSPTGQRLVLRAFLPADEAAVQSAVAAFLAAAPGRLPAPVLDVAAPWRAAVATGLRRRADDFRRDGRHVLSVEVADLTAPCAADLLVQDDGRILDPASEFAGELRALRERVHGRPAMLGFTACLQTRGDDLAAGRVLVVETERGLQDRIALTGPARTLELTGPAGRTRVEVGEAGVRVRETSCRHRTCQLQGTANRAGELIACAPNRLLLRVESA